MRGEVRGEGGVRVRVGEGGGWLSLLACHGPGFVHDHLPKSLPSSSSSTAQPR